MKLKFKSLCLVLCLFALAAFGQTPVSPGNSAGFQNIPFAVTMTDALYWGSQPAAVQALRNDANAAADGLALAQKGFTIDVPIMVWQWSATSVMVQRQNDGLKWVPSALQPAIQLYLLPGQPTSPPYVPYDPNSPPAGSINVCTVASCYPQPPPVIPPAPASNLIGPLAFGNVYYAGPNVAATAKLADDGKAVTQGGVGYTEHVQPGMFGLQIYFTKP